MKYCGIFLTIVSLALGIEITNGTTDVITTFAMRDQTAGTVDTGIVIANLEMYYHEQQAAESADAFVGAHAAATDAHTDGECFHIGHGNYRVDWPDAAFDGGIGTRVQLILVDGDGGAFTEILEVELIASPATAASIAALNDVAATDIVSAGAITTSAGAVVEVVDVTGDVQGNVDGSVGSVTGAVGSVTGNVGGSTASVTGAVGSVTGAVGSVTGAVGSVTGNVGGNVTGSVASVVDSTAQTGDSYGIVNHAVFGNSKLARTTEITGLNDFDPTADPVAVVTLLTDHTPQTGDSYLLLTSDIAEPSAIPPPQPTPTELWNYLYRSLVYGQVTIESDNRTHYKDNLTALWKHVLSTDGTTTTIGEAEAP